MKVNTMASATLVYFPTCNILCPNIAIFKDFNLLHLNTISTHYYYYYLFIATIYQ